MEHVDALVIGAGVVGLAIAARLSRHLPNVLVIDKHASVGEETSSRNSEVIHAGIYYPASSVKAELCVAGKAQLYEYCQQRNLPHRAIGKLIVAQNSAEEDYLHRLLAKAAVNGVNDLTWLSQRQLQKLEPNVSASVALCSPSTGIIDVHSYMQSLLAEIEQNGGQFVAKTAMQHAELADTASGSVSEFIVALNSQGEALNLRCQYLVNSAGLHCEQVARQIEGLAEQHIPRLHWCRGHYFSYAGKSPFNQLIYPVPEADGVGLGIHATLDLGGQLKFGPDTEYVDAIEYNVRESLKVSFTKAIQRYFPMLQADKLQPAYAGIRPKLQGPGEPVADFCIQDSSTHGLQGLVNLFGIESPGLTASLAIAQRVTQQLALE